jgi:sulfane dehydrogenase subunit SoxC
MNWAPLVDVGFYLPNAQYYVHNRVMPPSLKVDHWTLAVRASNPRLSETLSYEQILEFPRHTVDCATDCGANGRSFYPKLPPSGHGAPIAGSEWRWGAMGMGQWTGTRLRDVLTRLGVREATSKWVTVEGNDSMHYAHTVPIAKALDPDTLLVYQLNGEPLPIDNGFPVRVLFPGWGANANVKWVRSITVSDEPEMPIPPGQKHQLIDGVPITEQSVKSAFELDWDTTVMVKPGHTIPLTGRAWSGGGSITCVEVSFDLGTTWTEAKLLDKAKPLCWVRFQVDWPAKPGYYQLMSRATDSAGRTQPAPQDVKWNQFGLLYNGHIGHPVVVLESK